MTIGPSDTLNRLVVMPINTRGFNDLYPYCADPNDLLKKPSDRASKVDLGVADNQTK